MFNYKLNHLALPLFTAFFLIALLFLPQRTAFAGDPGCQSGYSSQNRGNGGFGRPSEAGEKRQFAAAQFRNENGQPPHNLNGGETPMRSGFSFALSILVLLGGIWTLLVLLRQRFGKKLEQKRARLPKIVRFVFRPALSLSIGGILLAAAIAGNIPTAPTTANVQASNQLSVNNEINSSRQSDTKIMIKNIFNYKSTNIALFLFAAFFLIAPLFLANQTVFAGNNLCSAPEPGQVRQNGKPQQQFAAAQIRNERNQPPRGGLNTGETPTRSNFTFFRVNFRAVRRTLDFVRTFAKSIRKTPPIEQSAINQSLGFGI